MRCSHDGSPSNAAVDPATGYSIALTMSSTTFFALPNTIIVLSM